MRKIACTLALLCAPSLALAGPLAEGLTGAREKIAANDPAGATSALNTIQASAGGAEALLEANELAKIFFYKGLATFIKTRSADACLADWRQALLIDNELAWDEELLEDPTSQDLFEVVRAEVRDRPRIDTQVPEKTGAAKLYVDGERVQFEDKVGEGMHLSQIACPDGSVHGIWTTYDKKTKMKWFKLCPGGVDTSVVVEEEEEDEWGGLGPAFGGATEGPATASTSTPIPAGNGEPEVIGAWSRVKWPWFGAGAGALVAAGAIQVVSMNLNNSFYDLENPSLTDEESISNLRGRTNTMQSIAIGAFGVSGALLAVAVIPW